MAPSGSRARVRRPVFLLALVAALAALAACGASATLPASGSAAARPAPAAAPEESVSEAPAAAYEVGVELPPGAGRDILLSRCLSCHTLGALDLFKAFYRRDDWHALVLTMVEHGAEVDATDVEVLSDYLAEYFGPEGS